MGESSGAKISVIGSALASFSVETPGGRMQIRWDRHTMIWQRKLFFPKHRPK
jgi:hypothetical protein